MTNVPGPREPVYLAGVRVRAVLVWAPTSGSVGMSVSIFSYQGEVTVGLMVDAAARARPAEDRPSHRARGRRARPAAAAPASRRRARLGIERRERADETMTDIVVEAGPAQSAVDDFPRLDAFVERGQRAAVALRDLDQETVDRIVWAMVVAGLERAVELAETGDRGDRLRRPRGQGGQELHRHRVPLRLPQGQEDRRGDRRGRASGASSTSPSRSAWCSPSRRSPTRRRPCCSRRSSRPRPATPSSSGRRPARHGARERAVEILRRRARRPGCPPARCR